MRNTIPWLLLAAGLAFGVDGTVVNRTTGKPQAGAIKVLARTVLLEPAEQQLSVNETVTFRNDGKVTYQDPVNGTFQFVLPAEAKEQVRVTATAPGGMPVERTASRTGKPDVYKVEFPIKPGETSLQIAYSVPLGSPATFSGRSLYPHVPTRLVVPAGLGIQGEGVESLGTDPSRKAAIYSVKTPEYKVEIQEAMVEDSGPRIEQILPRAYDSLYLTLGLALAILLLGFVLHYRRTPKT